MTNSNKDRGDRFERAVLAVCQDSPHIAYRTKNAGIPHDAGDLHIRASRDVVCQIKDVGRINLTGWMHDAKTQALTAGRLHLVDPIGAVVIKRRGDGNPARSFVVLELDDFLNLLGDKS